MELSGFILIYSAIVVAVTALTVGVFQWVFSSGHWSDRSVFATAVSGAALARRALPAGLAAGLAVGVGRGVAVAGVAVAVGGVVDSKGIPRQSRGL